MPTYTAYGTYAGRSGRMLNFCIDVDADGLLPATELVRETITKRKGCAGKLSFSVFERPIHRSMTPTIDQHVLVDDICVE